MTDQTKSCLSVLAYLSMIVLPIVGLLIGWIGWNIRTGAVTALIIFTVFFLLGGGFLAFVKNLSWLTVGLPLFMATTYSILPNMPGSIDDTVVMIAGAMLTFVLWLRKQPETPKWIVFPLLISSFYTLVGGWLPGPVDELFVAVITSGTSIIGYLRSVNQSKQIITNRD